MIIFAALIAAVILACVLAAPLTFFTMLFLGNLGIHIGFWDLLPGAIAINIVTTSISTTKEK